MRLSRLTDWLEAQGGVDRVGQPLSNAIRCVLPAGRLKDALCGTWMGHPLHPVAVMVPIGSWTSASLIDLAGNGAGRAGARRLVGVGVLSALPAVLSGLADWSDTEGSEQRVGVSHAALNSVALVLYGASWWARRRPGPAGPALALAGMAVATSAGYLGGHMIYAQGVGVDTNSFHCGPQDWETVAAVDDLARRGPMAVNAGQARVLLAPVPTGLRAIEDRCSHRGGPLSDGEIDHDCVTCPWHASRFDLTSGEVVAGPATVGQPVYQTRVTGNDVQIRRSEERALRANPVGPG